MLAAVPLAGLSFLWRCTEALPNQAVAELRQFDKKRPGKKVSNDDWESPSDPVALPAVRWWR